MKKNSSISFFHIIIFFQILLYTKIVAQQTNLDSLIISLKNYKPPCKNICINDSNKVILLDNLSWEFKSIDLDSALLFADQSLELALQINWKKGIARAHTQKSICLRYIGNYDKALESAIKSLNLWDELIKENPTKNYYKTGKIKALYQISNSYSSKGNYYEAIKHGEISLTIAKEIDDKRLIAGQLGNLGIIYVAIGDYAKGMEYYFSSLKLSQEMGLKRSEAINYNDIGSLYITQNEYTKALLYYEKGLKVAQEIEDYQLIGEFYYSLAYANNYSKNYKQAIENAEKAIKISKETNYKQLECNCLTELCNIYTSLKNYEKALECGNLSISIAIEIENKHIQAIGLTEVANTYLEMKNYIKAESFLLSAMKICEELQIIETTKTCEQLLSIIYEKTGKHDKALIHYKKYIEYRDSLVNEESNRSQIRSEVNFEFDKKTAVLKEIQEKEKLIAEGKSFTQKIMISGISIVLIIVLIFTFFVFKSLKTTKKQKQLIELKEQLTNEQNIIITHQKHVVEEKQLEILDSINYAKRIQYTLLAHTDFLQENLPQHFVYFQPKDIVSGDFYWATKRGNKFFIAACDSTGHGVPGAFMSLLNISFLNEAVNEKGIEDPNKILDFVRQRLIDNISKEGQKDGFDGILFCFESSTIETNKLNITYASANNAPILISNNEIVKLPCDRMPVGKGEIKQDFKLYTIDAKRGDTVYLYTDGYPDQFGGPKGKKFKSKQLDELLLSISHETMENQKTTMKEQFENWRGELEQVDDICLIGIKI
jgi:serine phosphatase RsbU (regulator of sigma subunit)